MRVVFFGAGNYAHNIWEQISEKISDEIIAFADNNPTLWGTSFHGIEIIDPSEIKKDVDFVIITSIYEKNIRKQLIEEIGITSKQIYLFEEYRRMCYSNNIYKKKYKLANLKNIPSVFDINKMVIYTAITGNYDVLKDPAFLSEKLTYVCITNNRKIKSKNWNMEYIKDDFKDNIHLARHIKMNPHYFFSDFEVSVWVDGKYQILDDMRRYILQYEKQSDILCFPHPERECISDEAAACIMLHKGDKKKLVQQVADYLERGYPINYGLYETGCMVRVHNNDRVKFLMKRWEEELLKYSTRDQISFPYVCWENKFYPDISNLDINKNPWLLFQRHCV